jgi:glutathione S-transferase
MRVTQRSIALLATLVMSVSATIAQAQTKAATPVTIYHIEGSRGERIVWVCEELGIPYTLEVKRGDPAGSMQQIRTVNPLMPVSPTVRIGDLTMVESGAIVELLIAREGKGKLAPAVNSPDYPHYLQWLHFSEGSLAARIFSDYRVSQLQNPKAQPQGFQPLSGSDTMKYVEAFLGKNQYFGGKEFSAADLLMHFPIMYSERLQMVKLSDYPNISAWKKKVEARPAFQRAIKAARPAAP